MTSSEQFVRAWRTHPDSQADGEKGGDDAERRGLPIYRGREAGNGEGVSHEGFKEYVCGQDAAQPGKETRT